MHAIFVTMFATVVAMQASVACYCNATVECLFFLLSTVSIFESKTSIISKTRPNSESKHQWSVSTSGRF